MYAYTIGLLTSSTSLDVRVPMDNRDYEAEDSGEDDDMGRGENENMDDLVHYGMYVYYWAPHFLDLSGRRG
jgi:hypothetical protein